MTRRLILVLALGLVWPSLSWAGCPDGQYLAPVGAARTGTGNFSESGERVDFISGVCTGTACTVTLYDSDGENEGTNTSGTSKVKFETGGAASAPFVHDLTDSPLWFGDGVYFADDGDVQGLVLLTCSEGP